MLFISSVQHQYWFSEKLWDFARVVHVYDFLVTMAGGVEADSSVDRGHLARICDGGRDARAPRFAAGTPALRAWRPGRPRFVFCPSEKAR